MFKKNPKQIEALDGIIKHHQSLIYGGSGSGKSWLALHTIIMRAIKYDGTTHLVIRKFSTSLRRTLFEQTLIPILRHYNLYNKVLINRTNMTCTFPNGSKIIFLACQNPIQQDKILGIECSSVFIDELSEIGFDQYELISSRVRESRGGPLRSICCCNPTSKNSWIYKYFILHINPKEREQIKHTSDVFAIQINSDDNKINLGEGYIDNLSKMSERQRRRFYEGEWAIDVEGALWNIDNIEYNRRVAPPKWDRLIVGVDPATTSDPSTSDETGIVICGQSGNDYWVLRDESGFYTPKGAVNKIIAINRCYQPDKFIIEVNQGGDWILDSISLKDPTVPIKGVHHKVSKSIRAEPVAFLYEKNLVHHINRFARLEDQMVEWNGTGSSPDRMDALVIALRELSFSGEQTLDLNFGN